MSLWSPVDLVSGGTGKTNSSLTNNTLNSPQFRSEFWAKTSFSYISLFFNFKSNFVFHSLIQYLFFEYSYNLFNNFVDLLFQSIAFTTSLNALLILTDI